ncbi:flagellar hook protein FlgE [Desulfocurvibacter africanus]|uniref:Flagellar hook protein FlgE n=1 Tax=Desulfocurvibacter africanus subsp. africanus str. Walvis Bay TaxID=690850 RepID=F3YVJ4_DESAF|nr:flagellar hook protein FlgE [Desulfocurvibacter africanus]EGJ48730.1 flagellar hook-basal body protein [Desulfocurvibacter africanus subsp. africanus str. Walvis Bay]
MGLSNSMWTAISGLTSHSESMSVIGNNLANANTLGFKSGTVHFEDMFYSQLSTASGFDQVGHGSRVSTIYTNYTQGPHEASSESTHVALGGKGMFVVTNKTSGSTYYTRAGNFTFNQNGYLTDPNGYVVQGWKAADGSSDGKVTTVGSLKDIRLESYQSPPKATEKVRFASNLDKNSDDNSVDPTNPFFSLFTNWDGTAETPLGDDRYAYQTTIKVYDEGGTAHDLTVYFDPVDAASMAADPNGKRVFEYVVTCDPAQDGRTLADGTQLNTTSSAGMLMTGTITFDGSGNMVGMNAFTLDSAATGATVSALSSWVPAELSDNGMPTLTANFTGQPNASFTTDADALPIEIDFGLSDKTNVGWNIPAGVTSAANVGTDFTLLPNYDTPDRSATAFTSYDESSTSTVQTQDGYAPGFLQDISVNDDGVVSGQYSNGQIIDLFVLAVADFDNYQGLKQEGGNLFSETTESGMARTGTANVGGRGDIASATLEQSNVDMSTEMVRLITIQRGFQANGKVITTTDTLMGEVINLKRS